MKAIGAPASLIIQVSHDAAGNGLRKMSSIPEGVISSIAPEIVGVEIIAEFGDPIEAAGLYVEAKNRYMDKAVIQYGIQEESIH